jgi:polyhydroxyalkanoate synthesis regulator phasin
MQEIKKRDMAAVRTAADLERKYNFAKMERRLKALEKKVRDLENGKEVNL